MKADLASELINNPSKEADTLYKQYHNTLSTVINKHAPRQSISRDGLTQTVIAETETKRLFNPFGEEINPPSIDPSTCRKYTSTTESACRPNLNSG